MNKRDFRLEKTYNKFVEKFKERDLQIITALEEFKELCVPGKQTNKVRVDYITKCGHKNNANIASILYLKDSGIFCVNCVVYNRYKNLFESRNCELLTNYDDFLIFAKTLPDYECMNVKYKASCGHINIGGIKPFKEGFGNICKECSNKIMEKRTNEDGSSETNTVEDKAIEFFKEKLKDKFIIKLTDDGCLADLAIKTSSSKEDKYLMVQIKSTKGQGDRYSYHFTCCNKYPNCLIICICDNKLWHFNGNDVKTKSISLSKNKKFENEINTETLYDIINHYIEILPLFNFDEMNIPISKHTRTEQEYRQRREKMCACLKFINPDGTNLRYDFMVNNYKIQEKVVSSQKSVAISRTQGKNIKYPYKKEENDFYWFHFSCKKIFIVLPEKILIKEGYIKTDIQEGKTGIYFSKEKLDKWKEYLFNYENLDSKRIIELFK